MVFYRCRVYLRLHNSFFITIVTTDKDSIYLEVSLENLFIAIPGRDVRDISVKENNIYPLISFLVLEHNREVFVTP